MNVILIDFYDSFTNNIASSLFEIGLECKVVKVDECLSTLESLTKSNKQTLLILGPGPGSPSEYSYIFEGIKDCLNKKHIFIFGICLGHQLIAKLIGGVINSSNKPSHGSRELLTIPKWNGWFPKEMWGKSLKVQRYNSLCAFVKNIENVDLWPSETNELMGMRGENFVTYQFHPESVGTSGQIFLFSPLLKVLYNKSNDKSDKAKRTL